MNLIFGSMRPALVQILLVSFVFSVITSAAIQTHRVLTASKADLREKLIATVFLQSNVADADGEAVAAAIRKNDPDVSSAVFTGKEQAFQEAQNDPTLAKSLMLLKDNPLPAKIQLRYSDSAWLARPDPVQNLAGIPQIQEVRWNPEARAAFRSTEQSERLSRGVLIPAGAVLAIWGLCGLVFGFRLHSGFRHLAFSVAAGIVGAGAGLVLWALTLKQSGVEQAPGQIGVFSLLPLLTGIIVGMAMSFYGEMREV